MTLKDIKSPADIKDLSSEALKSIASEMRKALITKLSQTGGHVAPNLGVVEATIALHKVFDAPDDKLVFDVSHQSYVHKMLTGRVLSFIDPDHYRDSSGYTDIDERPDYDLFTIGHTSTSLSLAAGLAKQRDLNGDSYNVIAFIGDGSMSGGEAFEGLDTVGEMTSNFIVVFNDNQMSIAENHGGIYKNFAALRSTDGADPCNFFKAFGIDDYRFVADGNDMDALIKVFDEVKDIDHPVVVHISTLKGDGYKPAEDQKEAFHYSAPFDIATGDLKRIPSDDNYFDIFGKHMLELMAADPRVSVITAGTPGAIGFPPDRRHRAGKRFIDVGIAEQTAVAMASGMSKAGGRPVMGVVSTFLQRAYDQLIQDVAINRTAPVLNIFYGGAIGMNDVTHVGWYDIPELINIPGWVYLAPTCKEEYLAMLDWAVGQTDHPVAIRVPGMEVISTGERYPADYNDINTSIITHKGSNIAIIAAGGFYRLGQRTRDLLKEKGVDATLINPRFLSGLDEQTLEMLKKDHRLVVTIEDGILDGGYGEKVARYYGPTPVMVKCYGLPKQFRDRYNAAELLKECHLDPVLIAADIAALLPW